MSEPRIVRGPLPLIVRYRGPLLAAIALALLLGALGFLTMLALGMWLLAVVQIFVFALLLAARYAVKDYQGEWDYDRRPW